MNAIQKQTCKQRGTSLIELMIAILVLGVGLLGSAALTAVSINSNTRSKNESVSTAVAKAVLSDISSIPISSSAIPTITDCAGKSSTVKIAGSSTGSGATLTSDGDIDFTQSFSSVPSGYAMKYTACNLVNGTQAVYDVRWNIATTPSKKEELVVVGAQFYGSNSSADPQLFAPAVDLRTVVGNQGN